jgi:hypothetical protein
VVSSPCLSQVLRLNSWAGSVVGGGGFFAEVPVLMSKGEIIRIQLCTSCDESNNMPKLIKEYNKITVSLLFKKIIKINKIYKEMQSEAVAKSYMRKGFLIYEEMCKFFPIYEEAVIHTYMTLQLLHSEFPYI